MPGCTLEIKAQPNAPRSEVVGWVGSALKIRVQAPALDGRANDALLDFLADALGVPRRDVTLLRGAKSPRKVIAISSLDETTTRARLAPFIA